MSILKKRIGKVIPVYAVLAIIIVGTAAGAFLWVSNMIDKYQTVTDVPIELQEEYMSSPWKDEYITWVINYTVHDASQCDGYIYVEISAGFALSTSEVNMPNMVARLG